MKTNTTLATTTTSTQSTARKRLSREERKTVLKLYIEQHLPQRELARRFNVSQSTISNIVSYNGISPCEKRKETLETKILALCQDHPYTLRELQEKLYLEISTINRIIAQLPIRQFRKAGTSKPYYYTADLNHPELQQQEEA